MTGILTKKTNAGNSVNQQSSQSPNGITATPVSFLAGRVSVSYYKTVYYVFC